MGQTPPGQPAFVTVVCPVCGTRLDELVSDEPHSAKCPDCFTQVRVPARIEIPPVRPRKPLPDVGTYRVQNPDAWSSPQMQTNAVKRQARRERAMVLVVCRLCGARIDTLARQESRAVKCPDCHELVRIPSLAEAEAQRGQQPKKRPPPDVDSFPVPTPEPRPTSVPMFFADAGAAIRREVVSAPPRWTFFSGVFSLPWHAGVLGRWVYLTFGLTVMNVLMAFLISTGVETAGSRFGMVVAFFVLPLIWICAWTLSYAAACCRAILEDTAAGNDEIVSWHEQNWREWILVLTCVGFLAGVSLILGHLTARLSETLGGAYLPTLLAVTWISFPIILLSSLEADSVCVPLTGPIVRSLWQHPRGWLTFYVVSTVTLFAPLLLLILAVGDAFFVLALLASPLLAACVFIYARLLGRLGWLISQ